MEILQLRFCERSLHLQCVPTGGFVAEPRIESLDKSLQYFICCDAADVVLLEERRNTVCLLLELLKTDLFARRSIMHHGGSFLEGSGERLLARPCRNRWLCRNHQMWVKLLQLREQTRNLLR